MEIIGIFIKAILFHHVGIYWLVTPNNKYGYYFYPEFHHWIEERYWYNIEICPSLRSSTFEDIL